MTCRICGHDRIHARYLCNACYERLRCWHSDRFAEHERPQRPRVDLIDDYLMLRGQGYTRAQIAERLGVTVDAIHVAVKRAALAGDTRLDYRPRVAA